MKNRNFYELFKMFLQIAGKEKKTYLKSFMSGVGAIIFTGLIYASFYIFFENLNAKNLQKTYEIFIIMSIFFILFLILKFKSSAYDHGFTSGNFVDVGHNLRQKLGRKLASAPLNLIAKYKTGHLNAVFSSNVNEAVMFVNMVPLMALEPAIVGVIFIVVTFFFSVKLAILMLMMLPICMILYKFRRKLAIEEKSEFINANAQLEAQIIEYIQGIGVLRCVNKTGENASKLIQSIDEVRQIQIKAMKTAKIPTLAMGSIAVVLMNLCLFLGIYLHNKNEISLGVVAACLLIASRLVELFSIFLSLTAIFDLIDAGFSKVKEILNLKDLQTIKPNLIPKNFSIEFENVDFAYKDSLQNALKNVNFFVEQGSTTAFVGMSGSGKTTATKMLMRYDDPQAGKIKIGGVDIKNMSQKELLSHLSFVFQDVYLFNDTILNNIKSSSLKADDKQIRIAAKMAHCDEFISNLPLGYDTFVGDIGGNLSGGEKQRISIARAILKNAPIVVLDEPTAALDNNSEVAVQKAISALAKDKTLIVIAHRLSTIVNADQILVFDNGSIVERGKHEELLNLGGKYAQMWASQNLAKTWRVANC